MGGALHIQGAEEEEEEEEHLQTPGVGGSLAPGVGEEGAGKYNPRT